MDEPIEVTQADEVLEDELEERIWEFNVEATGFDDGQPLQVALRDDGGELIAGLTGWTWGGCGYVDKLWVREPERRRGLGTRLLAAAEREAIRRGCACMVVSSHSFQAPGFYRGRGYVEYGRVEGYPSGHSQVHLVKDLRS